MQAHLRLKHPLILYRGEDFNANFYYFSGVDIDHTFFVLYNYKRFLLVPKMNEAIAKASFRGSVIVYTDLIKALKQLIKSKIIGIDASSISALLYQKLGHSFKLEDVSNELYNRRMQKRDDEIANISKATKIAKEIITSVDFSKCKTEMDVKKYLLRETLDRGLEPAFDAIVATDKNSSYPHYRAGNVKLGSLVLIDYGVKYRNYCSDLTRCLFLKKDKKTKQAKANYEKIKSIFQDIIDDFSNFETGSDVAKFTKQMFVRYKLPPMIHSIGHGVGLEVHELPRLGEKSKDLLKNTTLAIEPAVYFKDYGLRFEETIYFNGKKARVL